LQHLKDSVMKKFPREDLKKEIERSRAISEVGKVIVESAKTEMLFAKITGKKNEGEKFIDEEPEQKKIERPPAVYSNKQHVLEQ
jgi:hypothetical protein